MRFFFDACVSKRIAKALRALDDDDHRYTITTLEERFATDTADAAWISALAAEAPRWIIVTLDRKIPKSAAEKVIWREAGLSTFFLVNFGDKRLQDQASALLAHWNAMLELAREHPSGTPFLVHFGSRRITVGDWQGR